MKKKFSLLLALVLILGMSMQANAQNARSVSLGNCYISIGIQSNGVSLSYTTNCTDSASVIGCKDIVLEEKVNGSWRSISIPGTSTTNAYSHSGSGVYTGAVKGRSYRAHCTHYAIYGGVTYTLYNDTDVLVYN